MACYNYSSGITDMNKLINRRYDKTTTCFWDNVDSVLRERGMTWRELADKLNIDPRTLASKKSTKSKRKGDGGSYRYQP